MGTLYRFTKTGQEPQSEPDLTECERGGVPGLTQSKQDSAMKSSTAADDCERLHITSRWRSGCNNSRLSALHTIVGERNTGGCSAALDHQLPNLRIALAGFRASHDGVS